MRIKEYSRYNPYRVHPIQKSEDYSDRHGSEQRDLPKKEYTPVKRLFRERKVIQPAMVGVFLSRWA